MLTPVEAIQDVFVHSFHVCFDVEFYTPTSDHANPLLIHLSLLQAARIVPDPGHRDRGNDFNMCQPLLLPS